MRFRDRRDAGEQLAGKLQAYASLPDVMVLALPRGGVPVAYEVARALGAPLDVLTVRKLGVPGQPELALGAIATGGARVLNEEVVRGLGLSDEIIRAVAEREGRELKRRERTYRGGRAGLELRGRTILLIDDGIATGATMRAAVAAVREQAPARLVVAVPVGAAEVCNQLRCVVDEVVCVRTPEPFFAVGQWYENFPQTTDDEVRELLAASEVSQNELHRT